MTVLHVFDMDGTLLHGSACLEISRAAGVYEENVEIERAWAQGDFSDNSYWERCLPLWEGLTDAQIDAAFSNAPWLDGVENVFGDIRSRNEHSVVISQSPKFFVDRFSQWGVSFAFGALVSPGDSGGAEQLVSSDDKLAITKQLLADLELPDHKCIVYGDSLSDLALFKTLEYTVGVNAKPVIRELARVLYDGTDLWSAYLAGRELVNARGAH
ncbi:MAG: HAD family hydrolase [Gammaproteobacteria bacterium]|jgi:phosphoserine phosphatase